MKGKLIKRNIIAENTVELVFDLDEAVNFLAGQDMSFTIPKLSYDDPKGKMRFFSIVSSPNNKKQITIATRISDSGFKKTLMEMNLGDSLIIDDIYGAMVLPEKNDQSLVFIAGGIGITPFISMLRYIKEQKLNYNITLLYANKNKKSAAYLTELQNFQQQLNNFNLILIMTDDSSWTGEKRKIDSDFIKDKISDYQNVKFFFVGPPGMVNGIKAALESLKIKKENLSFVEFSGY